MNFFICSEIHEYSLFINASPNTDSNKKEKKNHQSINIPPAKPLLSQTYLNLCNCVWRVSLFSRFRSRLRISRLFSFLCLQQSMLHLMLHILGIPALSTIELWFPHLDVRPVHFAGIHLFLRRDFLVLVTRSRGVGNRTAVTGRK